MTRIAAGLLVIAGLYLAQSVLIPIAIAILLSFLLAPVADGLERFYLPRIASVILVGVLSLTLITGVASLLVTQAYEVADSLPKYRQNIEERMRFFTGDEPGGVIDKATKTIKKARKEVADENKRKQQQQAAAESDAEPADDGPLSVVIHDPPPTGLDLLRTYAGTILGPVGQAALVFLFVIFMLFQREDLRDRLIRLMGPDRLDVATGAIDDAGSRISRYLLMQLIINVTYGLPVAIGLWLFGLPGALLWGLLAALLRFIPFLGPWLAASMPIVLSLAVFEGWYWPLGVIGLFVALELFSNNVVEPWLYGSSTGLSPMGVILAVVFWSALWGLVGLAVAIPLTVCLVVAGRYLPQFEFFTILLSRDPALTSAERFYQRLLAGDQEEAEDLAHDHLERHGLMSLYDRVMVPALHLAERNRHAGQLSADKVQSILEVMTAIVEDMGERQERTLDSHKPGDSPPSTNNDYVVLCLPARDAADELTAIMFAQVLRATGVTVETGSMRALSGEVVARVDATATALVCVSALPPGAVSHARYLCLRLASHDASLPILVGLWDVTGNLERMSARLTEAGANQVVTTFEDGVDRVRRRLSSLARISD
ncbi:Predicted PurR-regulated permease PerM [Modicisalibacter muralis]|uniref:Predicted PurR-regulated permease PerM n=1 Tax=Modicisalibacter muralis TaxID=119000 RepID=A0A1G9GWY5_9GAMM|nr:AI-2E family transporter [Halomonas muralis]SDL05198.1 Predicted PurR-regulated permease PerM [Halomonas muralis]